MKLNTHLTLNGRSTAPGNRQSFAFLVEVLLPGKLTINALQRRQIYGTRATVGTREIILGTT